MKKILLSFLAVVANALLVGICANLPACFAIPLVVVFVLSGTATVVICGYFLCTFIG